MGKPIVIVIAIVVFAAGFAAGILAAPAFFPGEQQIRLGTVLDKTGGLAAFGTRNEQGARMAIDQINDQGGVFGQPIVVFHEDSRTDPAAARDAANKLVTTNRVHGIIGSTGSGQCLTVLEVAKANDVFQMSGSCTSPIFSDPATNGGWFARTAPSDALQGVVAAYYAYEERGFRNMAVVGINNPYGTGLADVFEGSFTDQGGDITIKRIVTGVDEGALTYTPDLDAIFNTDPLPEAIYLVAYPPDGILMVGDYVDGNYPDVDWIFSEGVFDQSGFIDELVDRGIDVSTYEGSAPGAYGGITGPRYATWAAEYQERWGVAPGLFDANVYDSAFIMALAAQASGQASGAGIASMVQAVTNPPGTEIGPGEWELALTELAAGRDINYEGASGAANLDEAGDPLSDYIIWGVDTSDNLITLIVYEEDFVSDLVSGSSGVAQLPSYTVNWAAAVARD